MKVYPYLRTRRSWLTVATMFLFFVFWLAASNQVIHAEEIVVTLEPETTKIRALDPLFVKIIVQNNGRSPLKTAGPLLNATGAVVFELRNKDEKTYQHIRGIDEGTLDGGPPVSVIIPASGRYGFYEHIFQTIDDGRSIGVFSKPGIFELRVMVNLREGQIVRSDPVAIEVTAISEGEKKLIETNFQKCEPVISAGYPEVENLVEIAPLEANLSDSNLKRTIQWKHAVLDVRTAQNIDGQQRARAKLDELRSHVSPVTADIIGVELATQYLDEMQNWQEAEKILLQLEGRNINMDILKPRLEGLKKNH